MAQGRDLDRLDRGDRVMLLQSIMDCSALIEPVWIAVRARLTRRNCKRRQ